MSDHVAPQEDRPELPEAPLDGLPQVLVSPPWTRRRDTKAPRQLPGLQAPAPQLVGRPGEFEAALALEPDLVYWDDTEYWDDGPEFKHYRTGWNTGDNCLEQLARKGVAIADAVARNLHKMPWHGRALLPIRSAAAASIAAHWFLRTKEGRAAGLDWFDRHGLHAVPLLVPEAFGPKAYQRTTARGALRLLAWRYGAPAVVRAVEPHGDAAVAAVAALFDTDPHQPLLNDPKSTWWTGSDRIPPVLTADRTAVLPTSATLNLIKVLRQWAPRVPYPGVADAAAACDRDSLARFSLALAEAWIAAGEPGSDHWALSQLAYFRLPEAAALLETQIPRWGGRQADLTAFALETLAAFPAKTAFPALYRLSRGTMKPRQRQDAAARAEHVARRLGTDPEALADRLAPTLGLDDPATYVLDFGPRAFHLRVDERLNLSVADAAGKTRTRLPRPGVRDDAEAAAASIARFRTLSKDLAAAKAFQSARLEDAMLEGRRWSADEFARITANPLLAALARGLLWIGGTDEAAQRFRLAEDGTFADIDDKPFALAEGDVVRLAHPVLLGPDLTAWTEVFADYEILQPFDQLARPALTLFPEEVEDGELYRFAGAVTTFARLREVMDLRHMELVRSPHEPIEYSRRFAEVLPGGVRLMAEVDPVIVTSKDPEPDFPLTIKVIWFAATKNRHRDAPALAGDDLLRAVDPVPLAEILAGLGRATGLHH
jgi:hypothetical protein